MTGRLVIWLVKHPISSVVIALAMFTVVGFELTSSVTGGQPAAVPTDAVVVGGTAESTLPSPTQFPPRSRVEEAHRALHAMGRACKVPISKRAPESVRGPVEIMKRFGRDFPDGGFTIDDEPGTTLSLLVVLRYELQNCDPSLVASVEDLLPQRFRDPS